MAGQDVKGIVDITGSPQFEVAVYLFKDSTTSRGVANAGSANQTVAGLDIATSRGGLEAGDILLKGKVQRAAYPMPQVLKNAYGTLIMQFEYDPSAPLQKSNPIRVEEATFTFDQKEEDEWDVTLICKRTDVATWSGWNGTQPNPSAPTAGTRYLYDQRRKTFDPNGLVPTSLQTIDFWGLAADTDAGELTQMALVVAKYTNPQLHGKLYTATITRTDGGGGRIDLEWRARDSKDDVVMPEQVQVRDPGHLEDLYTSGIVFGTLSSIASAGSLAPPAAHLVLNKSTVRVLTSAFKNRNDEWANSNSTLRETMPRSQRHSDAFRLTDAADVASVASGSILGSAVPSWLVPRGTRLEQLGVDRFVIVQESGVRSPKDDVTMPRTMRHVDPQNITSHAASAIVTSGTIPLIASGMSYFTSAGREFRQLTPGRYVSVNDYRLQNSAQEIVNKMTRSLRSALMPYVDVVATPFDCLPSDTPVTLAAGLWASFQLITNAYKVEVQKINPIKAVAIFHYLNPGIQVVGSTFGGGRYVKARINSGTPQVFIAQKRSIDGTLSQFSIRSKYITSAPMRRFIVVRASLGTTIPDHASIIGQASTGSFLGISGGNVIYNGAKYVTNIGLSGTFPFMMYYDFQNDANGYFDYEGYMDEDFVSSSTATTGWVNASGFSANEVNVIPALATADFATTFLS